MQKKYIIFIWYVLKPPPPLWNKKSVHPPHTVLKQILKVVSSNSHQKQTIFMIFGRLLGEFFDAILS